MPQHRYSPPTDEKDRRILARELFLKNISEEEITSTTMLPPLTVRKIGEWLRGPYGMVWVKEKHPGVEWRNDHWEKVEQAVKPSETPPAAEIEPGVPSESLPEGSYDTSLEQPGVPSPGDSAGQGAAPSLPPPPSQVVREVSVDDQGRILEMQPRTETSQLESVTLEMQKERFDSPPATGKRNNAFLTPATIYYFDYARAHGATIDLPHFIEECVVGLFKHKYNTVLAFVKTVKS